MEKLGEVLKRMHREALINGLTLDEWNTDFKIVRWVVNHLKTKGVIPVPPHPMCKKRGSYEKVIYDFSRYARSGYVEHFDDDFDDFIEYLLFRKGVRDRLVHGKSVKAWTAREEECSEKHSPFFDNRLSELKALLEHQQIEGDSILVDSDE